MSKLQIINLHVSVEGKEILKGVNLEMNTNEFHIIMGPNGTGKSTLASTIMGHYKYQVTEGQILLDGEDVLKMSVDERSRKGLFLAMQYPSEISGVTNSDFIKSALQARMAEGERVSLFKFIKSLDKAVSELKMNPDLPRRYVNEGFSGGEKKRNEILQMKLLKPKFALLDEIDSGLDVLEIAVFYVQADFFVCIAERHSFVCETIHLINAENVVIHRVVENVLRNFYVFQHQHHHINATVNFGETRNKAFFNYL